jgi:uncharacterized coiled-coil protein SlyX
MNNRIEQLNREISEKRAEMARLQKELTKNERGLAIKELHEFTDAEKIKAFDEAHGYVMQIVSAVEKDRDHEEDPQYALEYLVQKFGARDTKQFWKYYLKNKDR